MWATGRLRLDGAAMRQYLIVMDDSYVKRQAFMLVAEGLQYQTRGEFERAAEIFSRSLELFPTAEAHTYRGWAYQLMGRVDDAIAECKRAIEIDPTFGNPYNDIGAYLISKGMFDEATEWLEKAKTAPRYEPRHYPYMNLGRVYAAKGMLLKAIAEFEAALRIEPEEPTCIQMLGQLRSMLN